MSDVELVVGNIPLGVTPEGWKVLKNNRDLALGLIEEFIKECNSSIIEVNSRTNERAIYMPYLKSCLRELDRIKDISH